MKKLTAFLVLALASVALVACGGSDDNGTTTTTSEAAGNGAATGEKTAGGEAMSREAINLEADPDGQLAYTTTTLSADAGSVTIDFDNPAPITHDVAIEDSGGNEVGQSDLIAEDTTSLVLRDLRPGTYAFYCTVPGHREAGMEGTLTVR